MVYKTISKLASFSPIKDSTKATDLSTAVTIRIDNGASGILIQAVDGDIYMAISTDETDADASDFIIDSSPSLPLLIEVEEGNYISFLEKDAGGKVIYQLVR